MDAARCKMLLSGTKDLMMHSLGISTSVCLLVSSSHGGSTFRATYTYTHTEDCVTAEISVWRIPLFFLVSTSPMNVRKSLLCSKAVNKFLLRLFTTQILLKKHNPKQGTVTVSCGRCRKVCEMHGEALPVKYLILLKFLLCLSLTVSSWTNFSKSLILYNLF